MLKVMAVYSEMQMNLFLSQPVVIAEDVPYEDRHRDRNPLHEHAGAWRSPWAPSAYTRAARWPRR